MSSSGIFKDYFGRGLIADRPAAASLSISAGTGAQYWATDTATLYELNLAGSAWVAVGGGGGGGAPAVGTHRYWLLSNLTAEIPFTAISISDLLFRATPGGADLTAPTVTVPDFYSAGYDGSKAVAGPTQFWAANSSGPGQWLLADFGTPVAVQQMAMRARPDGSFNQRPRLFKVSCSTDGKTFIEVCNVILPVGAAAGDQQTWLVPINFVTLP